MNELYVLGELMDTPMHGYLLHTVLNRIIGPTRKISWGVLYPLIHSLQADGLIEQAPDELVTDNQQGRGRKKKSYQITEDGRRRFFQLMEEPIPYSQDYELHFYIKLANFDQISADLQLLALHQYKDYLRFERRHDEERIENVSSNEYIPERERKYILIALQHRLEKIRFDEAWVLGLISNHRANIGGIDNE